MEKNRILIVLTSSDKDNKHSAENTPSDFATNLPQPLMLDDKWKVALTEITLSTNLRAFEKEYLIFQKDIPVENSDSTHSTKPRDKIEKQNVLDINMDDHKGKPDEESDEEELPKSGVKNNVKTLSKKLVLKKVGPSLENVLQYITDTTKNNNITDFHSVQFLFNKQSHKLVISLAKGERIIFSDKIANAFSLDTLIENVDSNEEKFFTSKYCIDMRVHLWNIYLYSNLTKPIVLGDILSPLLQTLPIENFQFGQIITKSYNPPVFLELSNHFISTINIKICDEIGIPLKFHSDFPTICKLTFIKDG